MEFDLRKIGASIAAAAFVVGLGACSGDKICEPPYPIESSSSVIPASSSVIPASSGNFHAESSSSKGPESTADSSSSSRDSGLGPESVN